MLEDKYCGSQLARTQALPITIRVVRIVTHFQGSALTGLHTRGAGGALSMHSKGWGWEEEFERCMHARTNQGSLVRKSPWFSGRIKIEKHNGRQSSKKSRCGIGKMQFQGLAPAKGSTRECKQIFVFFAKVVRKLF